MRLLSSWVAGVVVLLVLAVAADRVAVHLAENRAVSAIEEDAVVGGAQLDIEGFPFLTQLLSGELGQVTGSADTAEIGGLSVSDVRIDVHGVSTSSPYAVSSGTASGAIAVESLQALLARETGLTGIELGADGDTLVMSTSVLGLDLAVAVSPVVLDASTLGVTVDSVSAGGGTMSIEDLPGGLGNLLTDITVPLSLPEGVHLDTVSVSGSAVRIEVVGQDVALEELVSS